MNLNRMLVPVFLVSFSMTMIGAIMKILHYDGSDTLMMVGFIGSALFACMAIYVVVSGKAFCRSEKIMWTMALIFLGSLGGLIYILAGRRQLKSPPLHA